MANIYVRISQKTATLLDRQVCLFCKVFVNKNDKILAEIVSLVRLEILFKIY